jgi:hypothetical protein
MMSETRCSFSTIVFAISVCTSTAAPLAQELTPAEIYGVLHEQFGRLETIDVTSRTISVRGEVQPEADWTLEAFRDNSGPFREQIRENYSNFRMKGNKFRNSCDIEPLDNVDYAFDGLKYQILMHKSRFLWILDGPGAFGSPSEPYCVAPGTISPFEFVFYATNEASSFDTLRNGSVWAKLAAMSRSLPDETIEGHLCAVVEVTIEDHPFHGIERTKAYFAKEKAYFPIRYERYIGNDIFHIFRAADIREAVQCGRPPRNFESYYIAGRSVLQTYDSMGSGRPTGGQVMEIDVDSARVNLEIHDAFFTIPASEALSVMDQRATK